MQVPQSSAAGRSFWVGFALLAVLILLVFPLVLDSFRLNLVGRDLTYAFVALGLVLCWGYGGILSLGQGVFFGLGGYCLAMFLKLEASTPEATAIQSTPGIPGLHGLEPNHQPALVLGALQQLPRGGDRRASGPGCLRLHHRRGHVQATRERGLLRDHHAGDRRHHDHPDHRSTGLHRRHQRHNRPAHVARLGHPHRAGQDHPLLRQRGAFCLAHWFSRVDLAVRSSAAS